MLTLDHNSNNWVSHLIENLFAYTMCLCHKRLCSFYGLCIVSNLSLVADLDRIFSRYYNLIRYCSAWTYLVTFVCVMHYRVWPVHISCPPTTIPWVEYRRSEYMNPVLLRVVTSRTRGITGMSIVESLTLFCQFSAPPRLPLLVEGPL